MKTNSQAFFLLVITTLGVLAKGISFLLLGRMLPLLVATIPVTAILLLLFKPNKPAFFFIKLWAWLLLFWAGTRLFIGIALLLPNAITENHVFEQFDAFGIVITLLAILAAWFILRAASRARTPVQEQVIKASVP